MAANNLSADSRSPQLKVRIVVIKRSSKVTKGGRRFSFSALAVVGNSCGRVGIGFGKSREVANAIMKAEASAATEMMNVSLKDGTIPHDHGWGNDNLLN